MTVAPLLAGLTESEKAQTAESLVGKNAMSGFLALMNAAPADVDKLSGAIANCDGVSEKMATTMQDNLAGSADHPKISASGACDFLR